jgi:hypothetical protein
VSEGVATFPAKDRSTNNCLSRASKLGGAMIAIRTRAIERLILCCDHRSAEASSDGGGLSIQANQSGENGLMLDQKKRAPFTGLV